jgi:hypothetical protein
MVLKVLKIRRDAVSKISVPLFTKKISYAKRALECLTEIGKTKE